MELSRALRYPPVSRGSSKLNKSRCLQDESGAFFIDRDPRYFRIILNYLRSDGVHLGENVSLDGKPSVLRLCLFCQILSSPSSVVRISELKTGFENSLPSRKNRFESPEFFFYLPIRSEFNKILAVTGASSFNATLICTGQYRILLDASG